MLVSFFLPMQWQPIGLFLPIVYFLVESSRSVEGLQKRNVVPALFLGAGYLLYLLAFAYTPKEFVGVLHMLCEYRVSYLLIPLTLSLVAPRYLKVIWDDMAWFIYGAIAMCIVTNIAFALKFATAPTGFQGVTHVAYRVYFEEFCGHHPTYVSMYLVLGAGYLLAEAEHMNRILKYALFYSILFFLLPLLAKSPLIALVFMAIHQAWVRRSKLWQYKWVFVGMLALLVASYLFIPFVSQRVQEMTGLSHAQMKGNITDNSIYVRKMIWTVDTTLLKRYWLLGCGPARTMHLLGTKYFFYSLQYGYNIGVYDPHSEYFYQWISFGLAGIGLFVSVLVTHISRSIRKRDVVYTYLMLILIITCFTESVLTTQHGIIFFSFFTCLFFFKNVKQKSRIY